MTENNYYFDCSHWSDHWKSFETLEELQEHYKNSGCPNKIGYMIDDNSWS